LPWGVPSEHAPLAASTVQALPKPL
jgi:hypothetical protein